MNRKALEWALRIGVAGEFIGHGVFALQQKAGWIKYFEAVGVNADQAMQLMPYIGAMDLLLAAIVLVRPLRGLLLWMTFWGLWTAMIRWPLGPDPFWDFVERSANWAAPLALLFYYGLPKNLSGWFSFRKS